MAVVPSNMLPLGTKAPDFTLIDTITGKSQSLDALKSDVATVIIFMCNHCPFVKHIRDGLIQFSHDYQPKGVQVVTINSNDVENYPDDAPEKMKQVAEQYGYPFPYLFDETQNVAKAYQAACTPDCYVFDRDLLCVYRGRFDDATPSNNKPVTGNDIRTAVDNVLAGKPVDADQKTSFGCSIKWKTH